MKPESDNIYRLSAHSDKGSSAYRPVSCATYDELELAVLRKQVLQIEYRPEGSATGNVISESHTPVDVFASKGVEYAKFSSGLILRLDEFRITDKSGL